MNTFEITLFLNGRTFRVQLQAYSAPAAAQIAMDLYPGARVSMTRQVA